MRKGHFDAYCMLNIEQMATDTNEGSQEGCLRDITPGPHLEKVLEHTDVS